MVKISLFFISVLLSAISLSNAKDYCGTGHMTGKQIDSVGDAMGNLKLLISFKNFII